jgi:hypothetical protein
MRPEITWCERGDSNPHGFTRQILSLVRLPIPPLSRALNYTKRWWDFLINESVRQLTPLLEAFNGSLTASSMFGNDLLLLKLE